MYVDRSKKRKKKINNIENWTYALELFLSTGLDLEYELIRCVILAFQDITDYCMEERETL